MKLTLTEPRFLKESVGIISDLVNEVVIKVNNDGLEITAMDPANVALVMFKLLSSSFVEYELNENVNLAVSLENLKQVLKRAKPSDTVILQLDKDKNKLDIHLKGESYRKFSLALIDLDDSDSKSPKLEFKHSVDIPSIALDEAVEDMSIIAESVSLLLNKEKLTVQSNSNLNSVKVDIVNGLNINLGSEEEILKSKYSLEYLKKMIKGSKLTDTAKLSFGNDYPMRLDYTVTDRMQLSFILAPRVDND